MLRTNPSQDKAVKGHAARPTLPNKNLMIHLDQMSTAQKTDVTARDKHREKVEQNVVQDVLMNGPRLWQVVLFEKKRRDFMSSLI